MNNYPIAPDEWFNKRIKEDRGIFDRASYQAFFSNIKGRNVVLDIGAHVGTWTCALAGSFRSVIAFEPNIENYSYLLENTKGLSNVDTYNVAIGEQRSIVKIRSASADNQNSGMSHISDEGSKIMCIPIDHLHLGDIDAMKIDVEGFELFVLKGAEKTIRKYKPTILVELNGLADRYDVNDSDVVKKLESLGYKKKIQINKDHIFTCTS